MEDARRVSQQAAAARRFSKSMRATKEGVERLRNSIRFRWSLLKQKSEHLLFNSSHIQSYAKKTFPFRGTSLRRNSKKDEAANNSVHQPLKKNSLDAQVCMWTEFSISHISAANHFLTIPISCQSEFLFQTTIVPSVRVFVPPTEWEDSVNSVGEARDLSTDSISQVEMILDQIAANTPATFL